MNINSNKPTPLDDKLYQSVKSLASKKFAKSSAYRSSWIVREYKKRGGTYSGIRSSGSLKRWHDEKWIDLTRPIKSMNKIVGYKPCGRKNADIYGKYPLCRPSIRVSKNTPKTYKELSKKSLRVAMRKKSVVRGIRNIKF